MDGINEINGMGGGGRRGRQEVNGGYRLPRYEAKRRMKERSMSFDRGLRWRGATLRMTEGEEGRI